MKKQKNAKNAVLSHHIKDYLFFRVVITNTGNSYPKKEIKLL